MNAATKKEKTPKTATEKKILHFVKLLWACRTIIIATAGVSIWANILHVTDRGPVQIIIAALPPLVVLLGWEMVSRIPMGDETSKYIRWIRPTATALISGGAAWLSYWHQKAAIARYESDPQTAMILPLLIDGLMVISSVSVYELNARIATLEAIVAAGTRRVVKEPDVVKPPTKKEPTAKERIAVLFSQSPQLSATQIAKATETNLPYVYNVLGQLKKVTETEQQPVPA